MSRKLFDQVINKVLSHEGGFVDHPRDPGGPTNWGIAWNYNQAILTRLGYTRDKMRQLKREDAIQIYFEKYWLPSDAPLIPDGRLAYIHFDAAVNHGVGAAKRFLGMLSHRPDHYQGGGANQQLFLQLCMEYIALRLRTYTRLGNAQTFLPGWVNRMANILTEIAQEKVKP